ncbi:MAG: RIP metalloprotease RseP [Alphaproteobacteria bacterium]|jgi:regulator of sigma E protease|nr:RIP metalloprotease RseP [Alphaproteobacteria bacterium]MBT7942040.1 RIP metalloprotease RseP [Alphaproteobacteria bacterium]
MNFLLDFTWYNIILFLFVLTVLVYFHEWGHYWVARRNNVRVEVFSIGFGPEIFGWNNKAGTRWKISAIPLGGYVKMLGQSDLPEDEEDVEPVSEEDKPFSFSNKTLAQRAAIVVAGPLANFLLAIVLFAGLIMTVGTPHHYAGVGNVMENSAAAQAGIKVGDRIVAIDGETVTWFSDLVRIVSVKPGAQMKVTVLRDEAEITVTATPKAMSRTGEDGKTVEVGILGVRFDPQQAEYERQTPWTAAWMGVRQTYALTENIFSYLGEMITGNRGAEDLGGPLRIAQLSGQMARAGFDDLIFFMAALSVNLGLINLFPIPLLDGGHLMFFAAEAVRGRPLDARIQEYGFRFGLILVLILMVFATWNDLVHLRVIEFIKDLIT